MKYFSTRGKAPHLAFDDVLLTGLASDGGLYLPECWPQFSAAEQRQLARLPYGELAFEVMRPFVGETIAPEPLRAIIAESYGGFRHPAVAPLKQLDHGLWLMELFHGPTLAFKDYPLQLVGRLFDHVLGERAERVTIVGATSGDTGSAAIEACRARERIEVFILFPDGRVTEVQRRQMTTIGDPNIHTIALEGTFDDCQDAVKALFNDQSFRGEMGLSAVNSINWARLMAQIVYYFWAGLALGAPDRKLAFAVPTGNFGNIFSGYAARAMGLPIEQLIIGSNSNDILTRLLQSGDMAMQAVTPTFSPSMDIQVSSNFERLLFDLLGREGAAVETLLAGFRESGRCRLSDDALAQLRSLFDAFRLDDEGTLAEIARIHHDSGELVDPHTAIGIAAARARRHDGDRATVALGTAHPAKFPAAVEQATGRHPALPPHLADLLQREERMTRLSNDLALLQDTIRERARPSNRRPGL